MGYTPDQLVYTVDELGSLPDQRSRLPDHYKPLYDELVAVQKVVDILDNFKDNNKKEICKYK